MDKREAANCEHRVELPLIVHRAATVYLCLNCGRKEIRFQTGDAGVGENRLNVPAEPRLEHREGSQQ